LWCPGLDAEVMQQLLACRGTPLLQ
jgi:hypothetical protein